MEKYNTMFLVMACFSVTALIISRVYYIRLLGKEFANLETSLSLINENLKNFTMATEQQFNDVINRIETATNNLADEVKKLQDEIKAQGLPQDVEDTIVGKLGDLASRLESIGQSTTEPLPGVVGSEIPVPLGEGQNSNTGATVADNTNADTTATTPVTGENTGANTPAPQGDVTGDNTGANVTMNPNIEPAQKQPGDTQETISAPAPGAVG